RSRGRRRPALLRPPPCPVPPTRCWSAEVRSSATALAYPPRRGITSPGTFPATRAATRSPPEAPGRGLRHRTPADSPRAVPPPTYGRSAEVRPTRTRTLASGGPQDAPWFVPDQLTVWSPSAPGSHEPNRAGG